MSEANLKNALAATEDGFLSLVKMASREEPLVAAIGSCCLVGVIWNDKLYIANLGDSRAVKGYLGESNEIIAQQLTEDHNVSRMEVREGTRHNTTVQEHNPNPTACQVDAKRMQT